jgi:hypothetical protein
MSGLRVTLSTRGARVRLGPKNAGISFGETGTIVSASLPGTGLSYVAGRRRESPNRQTNSEQNETLVRSDATERAIVRGALGFVRNQETISSWIVVVGGGALVAFATFILVRAFID